MKKIKEQWRNLLDSLGLIYDPEKWAISMPPEEKREESQKAYKNQSDNIVQTPVGAMYRNETTDTRTVEFEAVRSATDRVNVLTDDDEVQLQLKGIDLTNDKSIAKALDIKRFWAKGKSNAEIADYFNGRRGYSERTIKNYTAAFSKAVQNGAEHL